MVRNVFSAESQENLVVSKLCALSWCNIQSFQFAVWILLSTYHSIGFASCRSVADLVVFGIHGQVTNIALLGALPSDYITFVNRYYDTPEGSVVASQHEPATQNTTNAPNIDIVFLEQVWKWLTRHPEIKLGGHAGHTRLTLSDAEARNTAIEQSRNYKEISKLPLVSPDAVPDTALRVPVSVADVHSRPASQAIKVTNLIDNAGRVDTPKQPTKELTSISEIRLYASKNRMWYALTGHGPDLSKVRDLDFACLSLIAASGLDGIYQNDLVRKTGQDKRSLPTRTERLYEDGYIQKKRVCVQLFNPKRLMHTSHLVLKRFVGEIQNGTEDSGQLNATVALTEKSAKGPRNLDEDRGVEISGQRVPNEEMANKERSIPQWVPDRSLSNQIFDLVNQSGTQGMSMNVSADAMMSASRVSAADLALRPYETTCSVNTSEGPLPNT